ncbi:hypothetical protein [Nitrososphaeria virus YSH_462411]|uniref:Uncharacterized protein n=1 Tax=Nitrososphaeria virus YSH_462411 TaxID=3071321 RepID=A0A976UAH9_9CAUD|nr:hypothetical protein QKV92_gp36 [Yangshan Harbor Nitrososphaeria virus]UVF62308.1 hypothetical protein [Nitrososphaeria virus YSH_462411]
MKDISKYCICDVDRNVKVNDDGHLICEICHKVYHSELQKALRSVLF